MSHSINYSDLPADQKSAKAIEDIKFWLGAAQFDRIHAAVKVEYMIQPFGLETFRFNASFAGVQGYPVEAWYELIVAECKEHAK